MRVDHVSQSAFSRAPSATFYHHKTLTKYSSLSKSTSLNSKLISGLSCRKSSRTVARTSLRHWAKVTNHGTRKTRGTSWWRVWPRTARSAATSSWRTKGIATSRKWRAKEWSRSRRARRLSVSNSYKKRRPRLLGAVRRSDPANSKSSWRRSGHFPGTAPIWASYQATVDEAKIM